MGLNFTHCNAGWSYSGFEQFRKRIADQLNIPYPTFEQSMEFDYSQWSTIHDDIMLLLNHSDCDGEFSPDDCEKLIPRLTEIIAAWPNNDYDKIQSLELCRGMKAAIETKTSMEFG